MEFLQQILSQAGADTLRAFTVAPGYGGYFRDVKGVAEFSPQKIVLNVGRLLITVIGSRLSVGSFSGGDMFISGSISGVTVE